MSAFTEPLAQVREKLGWLIGLDWDDDTDVQKYARESLAALARVERLATDYETALRNIRDAADTTGSRVLRDVARRTLLSAREEGADTR